MDVDELDLEWFPKEYNKPNDSQPSRNTEVNRDEIDHLEFLKSCFEEQIGIPFYQAQSKKIYNFDDVLIAKGFNKAVVTWQGLFCEL